MAGAAGVVMAAHMMPAKTVLLSSRSAAYNDLRLMECLTRFLGYALVLTMSGLQLPHIFKLLKSRCSQGVNIVRVALELQAVSSNVAYCIYHNFPLSTWGESMPLMAQYVTVTCLLLLYSGRERHMLVFVVTYVTCMLLLLLG
ncbi:hypothetical protein C0Q70_21213 [Pomacea canaliculata]|uniref:Mannose-P-dolichol utilization defect 1 protein homolog n=1 Tax=Pomacea canaliculata TaxID=400727 RepID=A0A2T7NBX0_POMCA|nr:hypothetical protein C0Q70_21213 [Pomacea canaliculata]